MKNRLARLWSRGRSTLPGTQQCPVCGGRGVRFEDFTDNLRETGTCSGCGSFNRQRQIAHVLRQGLGLPATGPLARGLTGRIYNVEASRALHDALKAVPGYECSEYFGSEYRSGDRVKGVRHEDLQHLSFPDESFDVVLSSDVLEHVPFPYQAHAEIARVLRPGGRHIFTVPFDPGAAQDEVRARLLPDGQIEYLAPPVYHGDPVRPDQGVLVYTIFGQGMLAELERLGLRARMHVLADAELGILGDNAIVFEVQK